MESGSAVDELLFVYSDWHLQAWQHAGRNTPSAAKLFDLEMAVIAGGKERDESEFRRLFEQTGFKLTRLIPTTSPDSIIEAVPV